MENIDGAKALFYYANEGIIIANQAGKITSVNPAAERMFGYNAEELIGQKIEKLLFKFKEKSKTKKNKRKKKLNAIYIKKVFSIFSLK